MRGPDEIPAESADEHVQAGLEQFLALKTTAAAWVLGWFCADVGYRYSDDDNPGILEPRAVLLYAMDVMRLECDPDSISLDDELTFEQLLSAVWELTSHDDAAE